MAQRDEDHALVERIYAALLGEDSWQGFLDALTTGAPGCWSVLHASGSDGASIGLVSGRNLSEIALYPTYYHAVSPWAPHCAGHDGRPVIVEEHVGAAELEHSEFFADFLQPIETRSAIGLMLGSDDGRAVILSLMTPDADETRIRTLAARISRVAPHLRRAAEFYRRTRDNAQVSELGGCLFDALHLGVAIVNGDGRVRSLSASARTMLGDAVGLDRLGRLKLGCAGAQGVLATMLTTEAQAPVHWRGTVGDYRVTLVRMTAARERSFFDGPGVCVTIEPLRLAAARFDAQRFAQHHRLTPAESRVLGALLDGSSLAEIARETDRSRETIRSQLKSLCMKTGTRGQTDLMRLVAGLSR